MYSECKAKMYGECKDECCCEREVPGHVRGMYTNHVGVLFQCDSFLSMCVSCCCVSQACTHVQHVFARGCACVQRYKTCCVFVFLTSNHCHTSRNNCNAWHIAW